MTNPNPKQSKIIIVAEDDKFLSKIYQVKLEKEGYKIVLAIDGEDTLEKIRFEKPALILLDIIMPKKSGIDVLAEMKKDPNLSDIPVIILTNLGQEEDKEKAMKYGAVDYIVKANISIEEVVAKIEKCINGQPITTPSEKEETHSALTTCSQCKKSVPKGSVFCPSCGTKVE